MADKIYTLQVQPGIKRDGTEFESREYTAGEWMRFQRGNPRKVGGYRAMNANPIRINRGMLSKAYNGVNYTFTGDSAGINVFQNKTDSGVAQGPYTVAFSGYEQIQVNINSITTDNTLTIIGDVSVTGSGLIQTAGTKDTTGGIVAFDTTASCLAK